MPWCRSPMPPEVLGHPVTPSSPSISRTIRATRRASEGGITAGPRTLARSWQGGSVADEDLVTSLRQAGVNRGDLVGLVISPALDLGLATADRCWPVAAGPGLAVAYDPLWWSVVHEFSSQAGQGPVLTPITADALAPFAPGNGNFVTRFGSGIGFADRGSHSLKGVPDRWHLFAVERT